jgi:hypothetical protein
MTLLISFRLVNMLKAFLHALRKSKFLHTYIQLYSFCYTSLYVFLEVDIEFFCI